MQPLSDNLLMPSQLVLLKEGALSSNLERRRPIALISTVGDWLPLSRSPSLALMKPL